MKKNYRTFSKVLILGLILTTSFYLSSMVDHSIAMTLLVFMFFLPISFYCVFLLTYSAKVEKLNDDYNIFSAKIENGATLFFVLFIVSIVAGAIYASNETVMAGKNYPDQLIKMSFLNSFLSLLIGGILAFFVARIVVIKKKNLIKNWIFFKLETNNNIQDTVQTVYGSSWM